MVEETQWWNDVLEGFKAERHPKLEVHRAANSKPLLFGTVPAVQAIASDLSLPDASVPVLHLDDVAGVAEWLLGAALPLEVVLVELRRREASGGG